MPLGESGRSPALFRPGPDVYKRQVLSLLPVSAFAAPGGSEYEIGDTFETTAPDQKPPENIPDGTEWVGPDAERGDLICKEEEHAHSLDSCYSHDCVHEHDDDCYPTQWVKLSLIHISTFPGSWRPSSTR